MKFDDATLAQIAAADPSANTWVTANAGSGKTHVLTNRVAQLLLRGTKPARILCLTYTKAAAAEMQNRLFERLGEWAMMDDGKLRTALMKMGAAENELDANKLRQARTLFAAALETPGGLKIQTIHAFCDAILRRFPLEAGVAPQFEVIEERQAKLLRGELAELVATNQTGIMDAFAKHFTGMDTDAITGEIVRERQYFETAPTHSDFGINENTNISDLRIQALANTEQLFDTLINVSALGGPTDQKNAFKIKSALSIQADNAQLKALEKTFITQSGPNAFQAKQNSVPTKKHCPDSDELREQVNELALKLEHIREQRVGLISYERTKALHDFATAFLTLYNARKAATAMLDYDDLIKITARLLTQSSMAQWVLYRLDGGLDHILVDEAQDTSPAQWAVIKQLAHEFTQDTGSGESPRTLFVVGDEKQSIYSFQGADPIVFGEMKGFFEQEFQNIQRPLQDRALLHSFRSAPPILELVDNVFQGTAGDGMDQRAQHKAFHSDKAGRVDIWPFILPAEKPDETPWFQPVDLPAPENPETVLANRLADEISSIINSDQLITVGNLTRPVKAGDFLILLRKRKTLFHAILKALKNKGIPVAGADVINVGEELAVRDILSLLKFIALADDDLSLAEAMRSPLLGLSEADLFRIAHDRKGTLWQSFRASDQFPQALHMVRDLRANADFLRPYELIERILIKHEGRENLMARLGVEVIDGLDELLAQAMRYEQLEPPTLNGFLSWFELGKVEIKRQMDSDANQVRLMTIHGAKGLEAPIVILPETGKHTPNNTSRLTTQNGMAIWKSAAGDVSKTEIELKVEKKALETAENMRLLYVALTRAESWLIICGAGARDSKGNDWYQFASDGIKNMGAQPVGFADLGTGVTFKNPTWHKMVEEKVIPKSMTTVAKPDWLSQPAEKIARPKQPLAPSKLPGAKALPDDAALDQNAAMERGNSIHLLLEHLPNFSESRWAEVGNRLLAGNTDANDLMNRVMALLRDPDLSFIFGSNSLPEVAITATISQLGNQTITGFIDRLVVTDDKIIAVDYKSNAGIPNTAEQIPDGILAQQAAYLLALQQIYPNHAIEIAILWTGNGKIMSIPHKIAIDALNHPQHLDDSGVGS